MPTSSFLVSAPFWGPVRSGSLVAVGSPITIAGGSAYKAFPGMCVMPDGRLLLVWRQGTDHVVSEDGAIKGAISADRGLTFGAPFTVYDTADDVRDPSLTTLSDGRIALSCFRYASGLAYQSEVLFSSNNASSWGTPVVVSKFYVPDVHTYDEAAVSAPLVEVSPSLLLLPAYMHDGAFNWNAFVVPSTDGGATFTAPILIASGGSKSWTEPWLVRDPASGDLLCLIRVDNLAQAWQTISTNDGSSWPSAALAFAGKSRNATILTASGALFTTGRNGVVQGQIGTSWDFGSSWETRMSLPSPSTNYMYGAITQVSRRRIVVAWSQENSSTDADIYLQAFDDGGA